MTYRISIATELIAIPSRLIVREDAQAINRMISDEMIESDATPFAYYDTENEARAALAEHKPDIITAHEMHHASRSGTKALIHCEAYILDELDPDEDEDPRDPHYCGMLNTVDMVCSTAYPTLFVLNDLNGYGSAHPVCVTRDEAERLCREWGTSDGDLDFDETWREADARDIAEFGAEV